MTRRLRSRDDWSRLWHAAMARAAVLPIERLAHSDGVEPGRIVLPEDLGLGPSVRPEAQHGGESAAWSILRSFLDDRGVAYPKGVSSPTTARRGASRLSPHLAWGCIPAGSVVRAIERRERDHCDARNDGRAIDARWSRALRSFRERIRWRSHFLQKLEDEPRIEFENFSHAFDGVRHAGTFSLPRFEARRGGKRATQWSKPASGRPGWAAGSTSGCGRC